ncbi:hypothetical protein [Paenibacillus sp. 1-49]|uniref:hypothetical protein n=1 Tax=Paenibacillus maysiensis TaxID=1155954 RepID=UPI00046FACAE
MRLIVQRVAAHADEYGLDAGTGTGNLEGVFAEKGIRMAGVDQSNEMLKCPAVVNFRRWRQGWEI